MIARATAAGGTDATLRAPDAFRPDAEFARSLDDADPLSEFRTRFHIPAAGDGSPCVYLCGNSLGLQPTSVRAVVEAELADWERLGVDGHLHAAHPWLPYHEFLRDATARLVGAKPGEVVTMNSLTVNLHLLLVSFYRPAGGKRKIAIEHRAFPSDAYAVRSQIAFHGGDPERDLVVVRPREGEDEIRTGDVESLLERMRDDLALVLFGGVNYYTGQAFDMQRIAAACRRNGIVVGFDLAHAAGNVVLALHDWDVDFAAWCSYKYLNAGPGATAGCFVHERHARAAHLPRFAGWWGHDAATRFLMPSAFSPTPGAEGWQLSNPAILPLAALRASMDIFEEAGMQALRVKSERLTGYLARLLDRPGAPWRILTPSEPSARGCQLSIRVGPEGKRLFDALGPRGVVADWREPDVIRVAPVPLYNTFAEVHRFAGLLDAAAGADRGDRGGSA